VKVLRIVNYLILGCVAKSKGENNNVLLDLFDVTIDVIFTQDIPQLLFNHITNKSEMNGAINKRLLTLAVVEDNCKPFSQKT